MSLERLEFGARFARVRRVLGDARDLGRERVGVAQELLCLCTNQSVSQVRGDNLFMHCPHLLALDLMALVALDLLLLHLLLVRHHGVRT